jgi:tetratricopeptide (TPR) repeat protein
VVPPVDPGVELAAKVASLKAQGNFNVMVIYANEWTRKQPGNATAWHELAGGYRKLRQLDEAFAAAKQAVALDGANPSHLRTLADIYVALERPEDALAELQKALQADGQHAASHAQAGTLYLQLVRLDEARGAFDRALALDPADLGAACGALDVARRQGRGKDAEALARALKTADFECNGAGEGKIATAQSAPSTPPAQSARVPSTRR